MWLGFGSASLRHQRPHRSPGMPLLLLHAVTSQGCFQVNLPDNTYQHLTASRWAPTTPLSVPHPSPQPHSQPYLRVRYMSAPFSRQGNRARTQRQLTLYLGPLCYLPYDSGKSLATHGRACYLSKMTASLASFHVTCFSWSSVYQYLLHSCVPGSHQEMVFGSWFQRLKFVLGFLCCCGPLLKRNKQ